jgi:type 1 glutamine amidotransferase
MFERLARLNGFRVTATEDSSAFETEKLARYRVVVFLNTTGDVLDEAQQDALRAYVEGGGGFVGLHAASDTEYGWPWYGQLVGAWFARHPAIQKARLTRKDGSHRAVRFLGKTWMRKDEWYDFKHMKPGLSYLLFVDEKSYQGGGMGDEHPIAWCQEMGRGRSFYTAMGHTRESYVEPLFVRHVLEGLYWAAGSDEAKRARRAEELVSRGKELFAESCAACHGRDGKGIGASSDSEDPLGPSLISSKVARHSRRALVRAQLRGVTSPPHLREYSGDMALFPAYSNDWHAAIASYIRKDLLGMPAAEAITLPSTVARERARTELREFGYEVEELLGDVGQAAYPEALAAEELTKLGKLSSGLHLRALQEDPLLGMRQGRLVFGESGATLADLTIPDEPRYWELRAVVEVDKEGRWRVRWQPGRVASFEIGGLRFLSPDQQPLLALRPGRYAVRILGRGAGALLRPSDENYPGKPGEEADRAASKSSLEMRWLSPAEPR